jgi:hypothetical protein
MNLYVDFADDWEIESIKKFDESLRCIICGEFMENSVVLSSCSHCCFFFFLFFISLYYEFEFVEFV